MKKYDLLTSKDVDKEYEIINSKRREGDLDIDEITFYCYLKSRINSVVNKTPPFEDHVHTVFKGRFENPENQVLNWTYEDCAIYRNKLVVGQPRGYVSLINLDTKVVLTDSLNWRIVFPQVSKYFYFREYAIFL